MSSIRDRIARSKGAQIGASNVEQPKETSDTRRKKRGSIRDRIEASKSAQYEINPEMGGPSMPSAIETGIDAASVMPQAATLEWADDAISVLSPEYANAYREWVQKARERSPYATGLAEMLTPDALDLATGGGGKAMKVLRYLANKAPALKKILPMSDKLDNLETGFESAVKGAGEAAARGVTTDVVSQYGEMEESPLEGELDLTRTTGAGVLSGLVGAGTGSLKHRNRMRADTLGLNADPKKMSTRTGGDILEVDEHTQKTAKLLEGMNIFGGNVKFDPATHKFIGEHKRSNLIKPPSDREIFKRIGTAKETIAKQINDLVAKEGGQVSFLDPNFAQEAMDPSIISRKSKEIRKIKDPELRQKAINMLERDVNKARANQSMMDRNSYPIKSSSKGIFTYDDFKEDIADIVNGMDLSSKDADRAQEILDDILLPLKQGEMNLVEMQELRRAIDQGTRWSSQTSDALAPLRQKVYKTLGSKMRNKIRSRLKGTPFEELNDRYSRLSDASDSIELKIGEETQSGYVPASLGSYNKGVQAIQGFNVLKDKVEKVGGQIGETLYTPRERMGGRTLKDIIDRGGRKSGPATMQDDEEINSQEIIPKKPQSFMSPQDRLDFNIPKQLQKMKVPRNSKAIADNPKLLEYKIAQKAESLAMKRMMASGIDVAAVSPEEIQETAKEIYESNKMLLTEMPEKIPAMLPVWIQQMPELFEDDKYSRIDDVVPMSKRNDVMEEIRKKGRYGGELSTHDMIAQLDELTSSGRYLGDKKDKGNV